jgi:hypothetical protein
VSVERAHADSRFACDGLRPDIAARREDALCRVEEASAIAHSIGASRRQVEILPFKG